eukprot:scaffold1504_cov417-Prasinococcus_capsulatus_cf.AAC.52
MVPSASPHQALILSSVAWLRSTPPDLRHVSSSVAVPGRPLAKYMKERSAPPRSGPTQLSVRIPRDLPRPSPPGRSEVQASSLTPGACAPTN